MKEVAKLLLLLLNYLELHKELDLGFDADIVGKFVDRTEQYESHDALHRVNIVSNFISVVNMQVAYYVHKALPDDKVPKVGPTQQRSVEEVAHQVDENLLLSHCVRYFTDHAGRVDYQ